MNIRGLFKLIANVTGSLVVVASFRIPTALGNEKPSTYSTSTASTAAQAIVERQEVEEARRAEEAERRLMMVQDRLKQQKREVESTISFRRQNIEALKLRQQKAEQEAEQLQVELADVEKRAEKARLEHQDVVNATDSVNLRLEDTQKTVKARKASYEEELDKISVERRKGERRIYEASLAVEKLNSEIATLESQIAEVGLKQADIEAEEMKVRTEWLEISQQKQGRLDEKRQALSAAEEALKKYNKAKAEITEARADFKKSSQRDAQEMANLNAQIKQYENDIASISRDTSKLMAQAEKLEADKKQLNTLAEEMRLKRDLAKEQNADAEGVLMKSTVAVERAKADVLKEKVATAIVEAEAKKDAARMRGLASAEKAAEILEGTRNWVVKSECPVFENPSAKANILGKYPVGRKLQGIDSKESWVKLRLSSNQFVYMKRNCGGYEQ